MSSAAEKQNRLKERLAHFNIEARWEDEVDSTNNLSSNLALEGYSNVVVADIQTAGAGRLGRSFISGRGGLYESLAVCLDDVFPEGQQPDLSMTLHFPLLAALGTMHAVQNVCSRLFGIDIIPDIKWPNDLQIAGKKICGILCRAAQEHGKWFIVSGIGVNVYNRIPADIPNADNLISILKDVPEDTDWDTFIEELAAEVFIEVYSCFKNGIKKSEDLLDEIEEHCITLGKRVEIPERNVSGKAVQIGDDGALCVQTDDGEYEVIRSGDVVIYKDL